ncbi:MAG: lycopene beta-cyclase CrtY [Hyphomicrobiales bacterium]|nr:lycopene beta-cyclase CrtY [Hyphomicrobiales bacterium]
MPNYDVIFAGGGLSSSLAAYRLKTSRPDANVLVIESGPTLGGNHTWSLHRTDLTPEQNKWLSPFIRYCWDGQQVRFPGYERSLSTQYQSITSERMHSVTAGALGNAILLNTQVRSLGEAEVVLENGETLTARCVIDGRGPVASRHLDLGFQKFAGLELQLNQPHGLAKPTIMDATPSQDDGYRFVYTLPFSEETVLIEDTYYANGPALDREVLHRKILDYAARRNWSVSNVIRSEEGTLPILLGGDIDRFWSEGGSGAARIGLRACLFHPTTGYSLPDAVRTADALAALPELTTQGAAARIEALSKQLWKRGGFYRMLNRFLFLAAKPERRVEIMQRFYTFHEPLIERFYAGRLTPADKARILVGRPPVSVFSALGMMRENRKQIARLSKLSNYNG